VERKKKKRKKTGDTREFFKITSGHDGNRLGEPRMLKVHLPESEARMTLRSTGRDN